MFKKVLTDPKEHNPNDFVYLVHGILDYNGNGIAPEDIKYKVKKVRTLGEFYRTSLVGHMDKDSAIKRVGWHGGELYSMFTFGDVGLIINPASDDNILVAWYCGIGSLNEPEKLREFVVQHEGKVRSPLCLFTKSLKVDDDVRRDNELILEGHPKTEIRGVFYRDKKDASAKARMVSDIAADMMQKEVPIIELPKSRVKKMSELEQMTIMHQRNQLRGEFYNPESFRGLERQFYRYV